MRRSTIRQLTPIRLIITTISMLIVIGGGVVLWQNLHQSAQARSNGDTVFDLGVPSLYFGQRKVVRIISQQLK